MEYFIKKMGGIFMRISKKIIAFQLTIGLILTNPILANAASITESGGSASSPVVLKMEPTNFDVSMPTILPIELCEDGTIIITGDTKIINNSYGPITIKGVKIIFRKNKRIKFINDYINVAFDEQTIIPGNSVYQVNDIKIPISIPNYLKFNFNILGISFIVDWYK
jgi:hypothetical protein